MGTVNVGVIGVGHIGKEVIRLLAPFNCRILANDILDQSEFYRANGVVESSKETIFAESDIVTIHAPLTEETRHLVNRNTLALMKNTSFLINTSRGAVVNQTDLKEALISKTIAGAALDVVHTEPLPADNPLWKLPNVIITPHISGLSLRYDERAAMVFEENLRRYLQGQPLCNVVEKERGY